MGLKDTDFFEGDNYELSDTQIIICKECLSHLCLSQLILSDEFTGSSGPAYLVDNIINYWADPKVQETKMHTGEYLIRQVYCKQCHQRLGWTYKKSLNYSQAYKEGKFVIEKKFLKFIANNSATSELIIQAKKSNDRRRRSSATLSSSSSFSEECGYGDFKFNNLPSDPCNKTLYNVGIQSLPRSINLRDIYQSRLRFQGLEEEDEDNEVFVDV